MLTLLGSSVAGFIQVRLEADESGSQTSVSRLPADTEK